MKLVRNTLIGLYVNLALVIMLWASLFWGLLNSDMGNWKQWLLIFTVTVSQVINLVFAVRNIVNTHSIYVNSEYNSLRKCMKTLKLWAIPYFIVNFILYLFFFLILFVATRGTLIFTPIPLFFMIPIFFTYLTLLFTSPYGIGFIFILRKQNKIRTGKLVFHILLQLCFVLDVVDTIALLLKHKAEHEKDANIPTAGEISM